MKTRVMIVDDHEVVRRGLVWMFRDTDVEVVAEAANSSEAIDHALRDKPDVALVDVRLGDEDGLDLIDALRKKTPSLRVVVLSIYDNPTYLARASALGCADYLLKGVGRTALVETVLRAARRELPAETGLLRGIKKSLALRHVENLESRAPLTDREWQVLRHIALGLSNRDIASALGISIETVKEHVQNVLRKIGCADRTAAAVYALRNGLT